MRLACELIAYGVVMLVAGVFSVAVGSVALLLAAVWSLFSLPARVLR